MKKKSLFICLLILFLATACSMGNTPTDKVEALLKRYNSKADVVKTELGDYLNSLDFDDDTRSKYEEIYLRQYSDLTYEIKEEVIDGDTAIVTAQIKVYDYYGAEENINNYISNNESQFYDDNNIYSASKALLYRIGELTKTNEKIEYTLEFSLTKVNDTWSVDTLTNEQLEKIHGTYVH